MKGVLKGILGIEPIAYVVYGVRCVISMSIGLTCAVLRRVVGNPKWHAASELVEFKLWVRLGN